jgi:hypothetical protein
MGLRGRGPRSIVPMAVAVGASAERRDAGTAHKPSRCKVIVPKGSLIISVALGTAAVATQAQQRPPAAPDPVLVSLASWHVVMLTGASAAALESDRSVARFFSLCRVALGTPAADSAAVVRARAWEWGAPHVADHRHVTFVVTRAGTALETCRADAALRARAIARGFHAASDTLFPSFARLPGVTVQRETSPVAAVQEERADATWITGRGAVRIDGGLVRITLPIDSLAPDASGKRDDVQVVIAPSEREGEVRIPIPWSAIRPLWEQVIEARIAARSSAESVALAPFVAILKDPRRPKAAQVDARARLGAHLVTVGDSAPARALFFGALHAEPCLTFATSVPAGVQSSLAKIDRPSDRCRANLSLTVARAALLPGMGHTRTFGERSYALVVLGTVTASLVGSQRANDRTRDRYDAYLRFDGDLTGTAQLTAARLYRAAEADRRTNNRLVVVGVAAWAASIVEAAWAEHRQIRRLERVRDLRLDRAGPSLEPFSTSGRVGLVLTFF